MARTYAWHEMGDDPELRIADFYLASDFDALDAELHNARLAATQNKELAQGYFERIAELETALSKIFAMGYVTGHELSMHSIARDALLKRSALENSGNDHG